MNSSNPVGGYFDLELRKNNFFHEKLLQLNSGRNCLEYILRASGAQHVYLPKYICDVILEPLAKLNISYTFYEIDENFEIQSDIKIKNKSFLLYVNYFGLKDDYSRKLSNDYKDRLILDCSQAFYYKPAGKAYVFYSPRKFFGVPDGGLLYTRKLIDKNFPQDASYQRALHLIKRIDRGAEEAYSDFQKSEESLKNQPIKLMSKLSKSLLDNIDYVQVKQERTSNYEYLHNKLGSINKLSVVDESSSCPLVYPFYTEDTTARKRLIKNKIFIATYWPNIFEWCNEKDLEYRLAKEILPLPIDQRYGINEMERIVSTLEAQ